MIVMAIVVSIAIIVAVISARRWWVSQQRRPTSMITSPPLPATNVSETARAFGCAIVPYVDLDIALARAPPLTDRTCGDIAPPRFPLDTLRVRARAHVQIAPNRARTCVATALVVNDVEVRAPYGAWEATIAARTAWHCDPNVEHVLRVPFSCELAARSTAPPPASRVRVRGYLDVHVARADKHALRIVVRARARVNGAHEAYGPYRARVPLPDDAARALATHSAAQSSACAALFARATDDQIACPELASKHSPIRNVFEDRSCPNPAAEGGEKGGEQEERPRRRRRKK